jgi:hypothetical protein
VQSLEIEPPSKLRSDIPPELDAVVLTSLSRDPETRWQRAQAMRGAVDKVALAVGEIPTNEDVARWVKSVAPPAPPSEASAVSIEISLIEARPRFGESMLGAASSRRTTTMLVAALLGLAALAALVVLALR